MREYRDIHFTYQRGQDGFLTFNALSLWCLDCAPCRLQISDTSTKEPSVVDKSIQALTNNCLGAFNHYLQEEQKQFTDLIPGDFSIPRLIKHSGLSMARDTAMTHILIHCSQATSMSVSNFLIFANIGDISIVIKIGTSSFRYWSVPIETSFLPTGRIHIGTSTTLNVYTHTLTYRWTTSWPSSSSSTSLCGLLPTDAASWKATVEKRIVVPAQEQV